MKHSVAKFFGVADEDEAKRERTLNKWKASTRRLQNRSFILSRRASQRKTAPRPHETAPTPSRSMSAAQYEMSLRPRVGGGAPGSEAAVTSQQLLSAGRYDSTDAGIVAVSSQSGATPPHPLDPSAEPQVYVWTVLPWDCLR